MIGTCFCGVRRSAQRGDEHAHQNPHQKYERGGGGGPDAREGVTRGSASVQNFLYAPFEIHGMRHFFLRV